MKKGIAPLYLVVGLLVFMLILNIALVIIEPMQVKNAVKATTAQNFTVDGTTYTLTGNGQTAQQSAQEVHDNINLVRWVVNVLGGIALIIVSIFAVLSFVKHK